jgi:hypothetical protein
MRNRAERPMTLREEAKRIPGLRNAVVRLRKQPLVVGWHRRRRIRDLQRLHDAVAGTALSGRYWMWAGLLLGWAREGTLMSHDLDDVDLAYRKEDSDRFRAAMPSIVAAGFQVECEFYNTEGRVVEVRFVRRRCRYEFFEFEPTDRGTLRYYLCDTEAESGQRYELVAEIRDQALTPIEFLGRTWLKHADHEYELEAMYGEWRVPDPYWDYRGDLAAVECRILPDRHG